MPNAVSNTEPVATTQSPSWTTKKLIQAAALAAMLVPLGSVAVETASITCGFGGYYNYNPEGGCSASDLSGDNNTFTWYDSSVIIYHFELEFFNRTGDFLVTVTDNAMFAEGEGGFEDRDESFEDYECIALTKAVCAATSSSSRLA